MQTVEINQLPKNEDAERAFIGLCLVEGRIPDAARTLVTTDFFNQLWREAFAAFLELEENGQDIDPINAAELLKRNRSTLTVAELSATMIGMPRMNATGLVGKIRETSHKRQVMAQLFESIKQIGNGQMSPSELKTKFGELEGEPTTGRFRKLSDIIETDVKPALRDLAQGITRKITTGFPSIDKLIGGGLSSSDVLVIAALPGGGKSALVLQMATNIARTGYPVAFLSGEMSDRENGLRLLSQAAKFVNLNSATYLNQYHHEFLNEWADAVKDLPIWFDSSTFDLASVRRSVAGLIDACGIRVLVIDYLQLYKNRQGERSSRVERIAEASQEVKRIARENDIAVIEVAQFNREAGKSGKPSFRDLEGSSQIEKDASLIWLLDREEQNPNLVTIRMEKGRNTGTGEIQGRFTGMTLNFEF